jgi:hypothetical protein
MLLPFVLLPLRLLLCLMAAHLRLLESVVNEKRIWRLEF